MSTASLGGGSDRNLRKPSRHHVAAALVKALVQESTVHPLEHVIFLRVDILVATLAVDRFGVYAEEGANPPGGTLDLGRPNNEEALRRDDLDDTAVVTSPSG